MLFLHMKTNKTVLNMILFILRKLEINNKHNLHVKNNTHYILYIICKLINIIYNYEKLLNERDNFKTKSKLNFIQSLCSRFIKICYKCCVGCEGSNKSSRNFNLLVPIT